MPLYYIENSENGNVSTDPSHQIAHAFRHTSDSASFKASTGSIYLLILFVNFGRSLLHQYTPVRFKRDCFFSDLFVLEVSI